MQRFGTLMAFSRFGTPGRAVAVCALAQLAMLLLYDLGTDAAGHPLQVSLVNALMLQAPLYFAGLLGPAAVWSVLSAMATRFRRALDGAGLVVFAGLLLVCALDLGMQRFRGERLSFNQAAAYGTGSILNSDWILPLLEARAWVLALLALLLAGWAALALAFFRPAAPSVAPRRDAALLGALAIIAWVPPQFAYYHQRDMARPPQAVLLGDLLSGSVQLPAEPESRALLRMFAAQGDSVRWLSDKHPLMRAPSLERSPAFGAARQDPPDIFVFFVESLRGRDVGWGFGGRRGADSPTPHLDSLAAQAVTFPHWIAGGEPSPRGFITLHSGVWEHGNLFIVANRPAVSLDALPLRLREAGYHTIAMWGGNPSFDNQLTWARRWYDDVFFERRDNRLFYFRTTPDHALMDSVVRRIDGHDRDRPGRPLFMYIASNGTHTPYELEAGAAIPNDAPPSADRQRRYDLVLRNADAQIARVIARLRARPRWKNTVIVVTGDHSDRTNEATDGRWRGMPTDALVATGALVFGPPKLIGKPRAIGFTASHVDLLPTVRAWFGDSAAVATIGRDLFDTTRATARHAVAINSRGYRLDRGGFTLMVDSRNPANYGAWRSFTGEQPRLVTMDSTPFAADEPARLHSMIRYWSALVDRNRIRPTESGIAKRE